MRYQSRRAPVYIEYSFQSALSHFNLFLNHKLRHLLFLLKQTIVLQQWYGCCADLLGFSKLTSLYHTISCSACLLCVSAYMLTIWAYTFDVIAYFNLILGRTCNSFIFNLHMYVNQAGICMLAYKSIVLECNDDTFI